MNEETWEVCLFKKSRNFAFEVFLILLFQNYLIKFKSVPVSFQELDFV
jgi:hypothetical protein